MEKHVNKYHTMKTGGERNHFIDVIRGVAIFLVVWGHTIQYANCGEVDYWSSPAFQFIYSFHMPLFALISGYLFSHSVHKYEPKTLLFRRFLQCVLPIVCWAGSIELLKIFYTMFTAHEMNIVQAVKHILVGLLTNLWFLWAMFFCAVVVLLVRKVFGDSKIAYVICIAGTLFLPPFLISTSLFFVLPFFVVGYLSSKFKTVISLKNFLLLSLLFAVLLSIYQKESFIYTTGLFIFNGQGVLKQIVIDVYRFIIGIVGSLWTIYTISFLYRKIPDTKIWRMLSLLGRKSMGIYIISGYMALYVFPWLANLLSHTVNNLFVYEWFITPIIAGTVIAICLLAVWLIEKNKVLNQCLLGNRKL